MTPRAPARPDCQAHRRILHGLRGALCGSPLSPRARRGTSSATSWRATPWARAGGRASCCVVLRPWVRTLDLSLNVPCQLHRHASPTQLANTTAQALQPIVCNKNTHAFLPNFQQSSTSSHSMSILLLSCRSGNLQKLVLTTESIPLFGSIQNPCLH